MFQQLRSELFPILKSRLAWTAANVIDALFLLGWVAVQYGVNLLIERLPLTHQFDRIIFFIFQILFALTTITAPVLNIYKDIRIMYSQTKSEVELAEHDKKNSPTVKGT